MGATVLPTQDQRHALAAHHQHDHHGWRHTRRTHPGLETLSEVWQEGVYPHFRQTLLALGDFSPTISYILILSLPRSCVLFLGRIEWRAMTVFRTRRRTDGVSLAGHFVRGELVIPSGIGRIFIQIGWFFIQAGWFFIRTGWFFIRTGCFFIRAGRFFIEDEGSR